jgi:hypothetical protein
MLSSQQHHKYGCTGNRNRGPDDPYAKIKFTIPSYAKIKFTIPSFSGYYDAEGYLDWEMIVEQKFSAPLFLSNIELDKPIVNLKTLQSFGGLI